MSKTFWGFDVVIVGSGPAGVHAAYPLVKAGLHVAIIDGGLDSKKKDKQRIDFLDSNFKAAGHAYDLIQKSSYVFAKTQKLLKIQSEIAIIQTLAKGGLSEIWDGICDFLSPQELAGIGLPADEIQKEYQEIARHIKLTSKVKLDLHGNLLLQSARKKTGFMSTVYQLPFAFSYKASSDVENLKLYKNFTYIPNQLVTTAKNTTNNVEIQSVSIDKLAPLTIRTRFLILAAGSVNTTRILLRSLNLFNHKTTFLTKAHFITACLHARTLAKKTDPKKRRFGQLALSSNETDRGLGAFFVQLYRLNPATRYKTLAYIPLPKELALRLLSVIVPSLIVADIRFPAFPSEKKFCRLLKKGNSDILEVSFRESSEELARHKSKLSTIAKQLRSLGLFPLKTVADYATAHYAGGVPFQNVAGKLSVDMHGKLHQAKRIYVADSSTWRALPAKAPTLTIMANARRVGKNVLKQYNQQA